MKKSNGIISCGEELRVTKAFSRELQALAAKNGQVIQPIKNSDDLLDASLRIMPRESLIEVLEIMERVMKKHGIAYRSIKD